ncbi:MAG: hypothetical protein DWG79_01645 [Chloroflexi bacterium]|nr:hypothetical protein [Chloroflexota bacterium]
MLSEYQHDVASLELQMGDGGDFEFSVDDRLIYSKPRPARTRTSRSSIRRSLTPSRRAPSPDREPLPAQRNSPAIRRGCCDLKDWPIALVGAY